jgi:hypothetical protein
MYTKNTPFCFFVVEVTKQALMKIGRTKPYKVRRDFLNNLRAKGTATQEREMQLISYLDPVLSSSLKQEQAGSKKF